MKKIASVVIDRLSKETDEIYDYYIPEGYENIIKPGIKVFVPFGKGNKKETGYVIDIKGNTNYDISKIKEIYDICDCNIWFDDEIYELIKFLKENYNCTYSEAINTVLPSGISYKEKIYIKLNKNIDKGSIKINYRRIIDNIDQENYIRLSELKRRLSGNIKKSEILYLKSKNIIDLKTELKKGVSVKQKTVYKVLNIDDSIKFIESDKKNTKQIKVLKSIIENNYVLTISELMEKCNCSRSVIISLEKKGFLVKDLVEVYRNPYNINSTFERVKLNEDQKNAVQKIMESINNNKRVTLINGVTGCGKTEIYLNVVEKLMKNGYGSIVLVPEISLTPQTLERFKGRFGDNVAVIHSRLSQGERYDEWRRIKNGSVKVVVGARSAVFSPVKNLKAIIIDEEHEYSYKSDMSPRYLTKDVAEFRTNLNRGILVLGSATPSIETYYNAKNDKYNLIEIKKRIDNKNMPEVHVVDMRNELINGNRTMFSKELYDSINENLKKKEQTIIFLNRRGYSTFVSCRACGYVCKCENCDTTLTYHANSGKLICHLCGKEYAIPHVCPKCGSKYIKYFGSGTEKVENYLKKLFPYAGILRMDMDTTRKKGAFQLIYNNFKNHQSDILIGTQMIAKGMDFKDVTLVGVIAADVSLNIPDFRAAERTFQLLTQVAGRSGRGEKTGKVIIQTYDPDHYSIKDAKNQDYVSFYNEEISIRKILNYPPFSDILYLLFLSNDEKNIINIIYNIYSEICGKIKNEKVEVLGPAPCNISKIKDNYRWQIIIKGECRDYLKIIDDFLRKKLKNSNIKYTIDLNPYNML